MTEQLFKFVIDSIANLPEPQDEGQLHVIGLPAHSPSGEIQEVVTMGRGTITLEARSHKTEFPDSEKTCEELLWTYSGVGFRIRDVT